MQGLNLRNLNFTVFDLETTGFYADQGDVIIEFGALHVEGLEIQKKTFQSFVNPGRPIPEASTAVHGITDDKVANAPSLEEALSKFQKFVGNHILVAQNAKFDMSFILHAFRNLNLSAKPYVVLDTMLMSKKLYPYESSHSLDNIMARFDIPKSGDRHRSLDDSLYTAKALIEFIKMFEKQGVRSLKEIEDVFIKAESILKPEKPKTKSLFG